MARLRIPVATTRADIDDIAFLGEVTFPTGTVFDGTVVGGLSGITYDPGTEQYFALSDDRSQFNPARFYTLTIDLDDGALDPGDVVFTDVTTLKRSDGTPYPALFIDPEGIAYDARRDALFIAQEGQVSPVAALPGVQIPPSVALYDLGGDIGSPLPVPYKFLPTKDGSSGIRNNLAFESLALTPNGRFLYTATENALFQDGPAATLESGSLARIIKYDALTGTPLAEYAYITDPVAEPPIFGGAFVTNGLVELLALDDQGTLLAMERSFTAGVPGTGFTIKIYKVETQGATDISGIFSIETLIEDGELVANLDTPVRKELLFDLGELGIPLDNVEGMTLGETLPDGSRSLILVSDNNFSATQFTQVLAFSLDIETMPVIQARAETPDTLRYENPFSTFEGPDSDDPAIWANPADGGDSIVITTYKNGGLRVHDLAGQELQRIEPADIRYNNVDVLYNVALGDGLVDIAIASDRANDTLAIFSIDPLTRQLTDITAASLKDPGFSIFGVDDGEATAYGLAGYTSPIDGSHYVFVTQADGNKIAQLRIEDAGGGTLGASIVRTLELPTDGGDPADFQSEGISIDRETGIGYVTVEDELGLLAFQAEPTGDGTFEVVAPIDFEAFTPDLEGVAILYGRRGEGALVVSSQGDSSFAVFDRKTWEFKGSFAIGEGRRADGSEGCDGLEIFSGALGDAFPRGLLVAHDGSNDPPYVIVTPDDEGEVQNYNSNFKYVDMRDVADALGIRLGDRNFDPREVPDALIDSPFGG
jgi:myo-inositol-hexaphosphate 3-phosphohydrolase